MDSFSAATFLIFFQGHIVAPLFRRLPKRGFTNGMFAKQFNVVNVGDLDAAFEIQQPGRYPMHENVNMSRPGFDLGIIYYASDTPYTQARTLGARGLSLGMHRTGGPARGDEDAYPCP